MQKLKQYWILALLVFLLIVAGFYWFQYKPYKARKDCAWKRMHEDAIAAVPQKGTPTTQTELDAYNKSVIACQSKYKDSILSWSKCGDRIDSQGNSVIGTPITPTAPQPAPNSGEIDWSLVYNPNSKFSTGGSEVSPLRIDYQPAQPAQPAKDWWAQTTPAEYQSCLRGKGF